MKTTRPHRSRLVLVGHCSLALSLVTALAADDAALRPIAFQNGVNQQSLGAETAELARAITDLIDELQRNGFPVQSLMGLSELAAQLNALGGTEMTAIANRLRKLGENAQADPRATATEAYVAQQAIEDRLKSLARQISIQQLREESARRLEALIARQLAAQRETRAIAAVKADTERRRLLESDQSGIGEDLLTFFATGENLLTRLRSPATTTAAPSAQTAAPATPAQTFAERINGTYLTTLSTEAVNHLKGQRYPEAYGRQEALIVELRKILQGILSSLPKEQRLANALQQVSALLQQEQALAQTNATTPETQQQTADQAQNLATQVAALSPEAAAALNQAAQQALQPPTTSTPQSPPAGTPENQPGQPQPDDVAATPPPPQPGTPEPSAPEPGTPESGQPQPGQPQPGDVASTPPPQSGQPQPGQPDDDAATPPGQPPATPSQPTPPASATAQALAQAQAALQQALAQTQAQTPGSAAQAQNQSGQPENPGGEQQASAQQPAPGQSEHTAQTGPDGQPRPGTHEGDRSHDSSGGTQHQIAGHGPDSGDPAQAVGALRRDEREAFTALQGERYPAEYSAWVQQYWRNLAQD